MMNFLVSEEREREITRVIDALAAKESHYMQFKTGFAQSLLPSAIVSLEGAWVEVNDALCDLLGYGRLELLNKTWQEVTVEEFLEEDTELVRKCVEGELEGYKLYKEYYNKGGGVVPILLHVSYIRGEVDDFFLSQIVPMEHVRRCKTGKL